MIDNDKQPVFYANDKFFDGCHRYGWLISIVTTVVMFIWFAASQNAHLDDIMRRVDRLETQVYELNHAPRAAN